MDQINSLYTMRSLKSKELISKAFNFKNGNHVPFIINTANYFSFGYEDEIPDDYYTNPESMYRRQIKQFENHIAIKDNYVPYLMPWFGTGVLSSAFGIELVFNDKMDPTTAQEYIITKPEDISKLEIPNLRRDGYTLKVLEQIDYFNSVSNIPIGITDCQGPLTTIVQLCGYENALFWIYDYPEKMHMLFEIVTDSLIEWITIQKEHIGEDLDKCAGNQGIYVPEGIGVWLSDDDAILMPPDLYEEFVVPYNEKIFEAFGGGILHYCGSANQHINSFANMKYLRGINNFSLGNIPALLELKKGLSNKVPIIACDFTPIDFAEYYFDLLEKFEIERSGLIIQSLFLPNIGLTGGRYEIIHRDEEEITNNLYNILRKYGADY